MHKNLDVYMKRYLKYTVHIDPEIQFEAEPSFYSRQDFQAREREVIERDDAMSAIEISDDTDSGELCITTTSYYQNIIRLGSDLESALI